METRKYLSLDGCINERLNTVEKRYNKEHNELYKEYLHRYSVLREVNHYQLRKVESKCMVLAYWGTIKKLEIEQK